MIRFMVGLAALMIMVSLSGCSDDKNLNGLINHFKENKIEGKFNTQLFAMIGAIDGGAVRGSSPKFSMEIYEWKDSGSVKMTPYKNGRFGMVIHSPKPSTKLHKKIVDVFEDY